MRKFSMFFGLTACSLAAHASVFSTDWQEIIASRGSYVLQSSFIGPAASAELGASTAMWHDSATNVDWMIVGAPVENLLAGAAYIYRRASGKLEWTLDSRLSAPDESADSQFGFSVAIDADTVVVTAPLHIDSFFVGAAYVYVRDSATGHWNQQGPELNGTTTFGLATALRGNIMAVSDPDAGKVHIYERSGTTWSEFGTPVTPRGMSAGSGFGLSLWTDGDTLLVGAPGDSAVASEQGSVAAYQLSVDARTPYQIIRPEIETSPYQSFGASVALSAHGIVVGSPYSNTRNGAINVYGLNTTTNLWEQQSKLIDADAGFLPPPIPGFGQSIATDGNLLVGGDPMHNSATIYVYEGGAWKIRSTMNGNTGSWFGFSAAIANDTVGIGALLDGSAQQGRVSIFINDRIFADGFDP